MNSVNHTADEREIVLNILVEREIHGGYSNRLIRNAQDRYADLPTAQRSFIKRLAEGTIEREIELDDIIRSHQKNPDIPLKPVIRCLLRMSIYQIYYMDSVPDFAACSEAVRLCRKRHLNAQAGFVNGLLRSVCRDHTGSLDGSAHAGADPVETVSSTTSSVDSGPCPGGTVFNSHPDTAVDSDPSRTSAASGTPYISDSPDSCGIRSSSRTSAASGTPYAISRISRQYSMPQEIVRLWYDQLGPERTGSLCRSMLEVRPVCIRLAPALSQEERKDMLQQLTAAGVQLAPGRWAADCCYMRHAAKPADLPGFREGKWTVQDESSQLVAMAAGIAAVCPDTAAAALTAGTAGAVTTGRALTAAEAGRKNSEQLTVSGLCAAPGDRLTVSDHSAAPGDRLTIPDLCAAPGDKLTVLDLCAAPGDRLTIPDLCAAPGDKLTVLDLCAAPGGKTMLMAQLLPDAEILAYDLTAVKTRLIRSNLGRMKIHNVATGENDASIYNPGLEQKADIVLCDVPCSGLGVMTRKRDIKYNFSMQKVHSLVNLQKKIVRNAACYVKPGGILIYSTCTINRMENEKMADYIARNTGLLPDPLAPLFPQNFPGIDGNRVQLFPDIHGTDGFFIARFRAPREDPAE